MARSSRNLALFTGALLATRAFGCAYATPKVHLPETLPTLSAARADVTVADGAKSVPATLAADVRDDVTSILRTTGREGAATPAAVRIAVDVRGSEDYVANAGSNDGCGAVGVGLAAPTGTKIGRQSLGVVVRIDDGARRFEGRATAEEEGSVYAPARRRALAVAIDRALADAARRGPVEN